MSKTEINNEFTYKYHKLNAKIYYILTISENSLKQS